MKNVSLRASVAIMMLVVDCSVSKRLHGEPFFIIIIMFTFVKMRYMNYFPSNIVV